jgi:asparagine synthase (glutamine-hydrolysing)
MDEREQAEKRRAIFGEPDVPAHLSRLAREAIGDTATTLDRAPVAPLFTSALEASAAVSTRFLRPGVWPVSPLCTPELVAFCGRLPREWGEGRGVQREALGRMECSAATTHPASTEDFGQVFDPGIKGDARALFTKLFEDSRLSELGLIDADRLRTDYARFCETGGDGTAFYAAAVLELGLQAVRTQGPA